MPCWRIVSCMPAMMHQGGCSKCIRDGQGVLRRIYWRCQDVRGSTEDGAGRAEAAMRPAYWLMPKQDCVVLASDSTELTLERQEHHA